VHKPRYTCSPVAGCSQAAISLTHGGRCGGPARPFHWASCISRSHPRSAGARRRWAAPAAGRLRACMVAHVRKSARMNACERACVCVCACVCAYEQAHNPRSAEMRRSHSCHISLCMARVLNHFIPYGDSLSMPQQSVLITGNPHCTQCPCHTT